MSQDNDTISMFPFNAWSLVLNSCKKRFDEDMNGRRVFETLEEKNIFDENEKLNMSELFRNNYPSLYNSSYLHDRGLIDILEDDDMDEYPCHKWKDIKTINFLKKHDPRPSILRCDANFGKITFDLPPRYSVNL